MVRSLIVFFLLVSIVEAHPGRLDKEGGHNVRKGFVYKSGRVLDKGTYHFHRYSKNVPLGDERFILLGEKKKNVLEKIMERLSIPHNQ